MLALRRGIAREALRPDEPDYPAPGEVEGDDRHDGGQRRRERGEGDRRDSARGVPTEREGVPMEGIERPENPDTPGRAMGAAAADPLLPAKAFWLRRSEFWRSWLARVELAYCMRLARLCMSTREVLLGLGGGARGGGVVEEARQGVGVDRRAARPTLRLWMRALSAGETSGLFWERPWSWTRVEAAPE